MQAAVINVCFTFLLAGLAGFFSSGGRGSICSRLREPHIPPPRPVCLGRKIQALMYLICWLDPLRYSIIFLGELFGFFLLKQWIWYKNLEDLQSQRSCILKNLYNAFIVQPQLAELRLSKMMC